jgi:DHA3 family macrolide efflux protein-like MFS transporter
MKTFLFMWTGQLFSQLGTALTTFALGIWVYQHTGSVSQFAAVSISWTAALIFMSPLAGAIVDRWDRRTLLILAESVGAARVLFFLLLLALGKLSLFAICFATAIIGIAGSISSAAYLASMTMVLPKEKLGRANGMQQFVWAFAQVTAPLLAGILLGIWGLKPVLVVDCASFFVAIAAYLMITIPNPERTPEDKAKRGFRALLDDIVVGAKYLKNPLLLFLCIFLSGLNLAAGIVGLLFQPMLLAFTSSAVVGRVATVGALGMLAGSVFMSIWGGPKRGLNGIMALNVLCSICLIAGGIKASAILVAASGFLFFFCYPLLAGSAQTLLQQSVAPEIQGRVFSFVKLAGSWSVPMGQAVAGPIVDKVFEPWFQPGGPLIHNVGHIIGVGPGRGSAFLFIVLGTIYLVLTLTAYLVPPFRSAQQMVAGPVVLKARGEPVS